MPTGSLHHPPTPPTSHPTPPLPCNWVAYRNLPRDEHVTCSLQEHTGSCIRSISWHLICLHHSPTHMPCHTATPHPHPQTPHILRLYMLIKNVTICCSHGMAWDTVLIWSMGSGVPSVTKKLVSSSQIRLVVPVWPVTSQKLAGQAQM